jgi:hypothetical protein
VISRLRSSEWLRRGVLPATVVVAAALTLQLAYGTALGDALLYLVYELGFVVLPGWLVYRALSRSLGGPLRQLAMGWALGYVLEILAFMLTAAIGARGLFVAYPCVVGLPALAVVASRAPVTVSAPSGPRCPRLFPWLLAGVCVVAVAYVGLAYFPGAPLPGRQSVNYFPDYPRWIAIAADAKHHWPIEDPSVAGEPLPYHYFVYVHLAAASQVTGLDLPLVFLRLFILPLAVLLALTLVVAGRSFAGSAYAGLIAACLAFFVGEMRLDARQTFLAQTPFLSLFFIYLYRSPSFLFGLVIFVPLITLLGERLAAREGSTRPGEWVLLALFMVGASDAKITILPLVLAALALYAGWTWLRERRVPPAVWLAGALTLLVSVTVYLLQYRGHSSGLRLGAFEAFDGMPAVVSFEAGLREILPAVPADEAIVSVGGILFGLVGLLLAPLVGLVWLFRRKGFRLGPARAWLLCVLVAGLVMSVVLDQPGVNSQLYFLYFGLVAGYILSAEGLRWAWLSRPSILAKGLRIAALGAVFLLLLAGLMAAPLELDLFSGSNSEAHNYLFWYGGLLLALTLLYMGARWVIGPTRWPAAALLCAAVVAVGALATPIGSLWGSVTDPDRELPGKQVTPQLYAALRWIGHKTPSDSVLAVNNHWIDDQRAAALAFDYSAFAERRVFLEGWAYSQRSFAEGYAKVGAGLINPFADRLKLNEAAFERGDPRALRTLEKRFGVRYLVVDQVNGYAADLSALTRAGRTVYRGPGVMVFDLRRGVGEPI